MGIFDHLFTHFPKPRTKEELEAEKAAWRQELYKDQMKRVNEELQNVNSKYSKGPEV